MKDAAITTTELEPGACHYLGFSFVILILILLLISTEEGEEIKIKSKSKIKRGTQKSEMHPLAR